ncbi:MAG: hypothetical protein VYA30_07880 [Myxococcota bacterium]|nr:hypothetical protein [Myxococcota bacterium]
MKTLIRDTIVLVSIGLLASGCGSDQLSSARQSTSDIPKWAMTPPPACGVGIAKHRGSLGMAQQTAVARGRDMLARQLQTKVEGMIKDYQESGEAREKDFTEELTTRVSRQIVDTTLVGTATKLAHLSTDGPQQYYALVCLQPEAFAGALDKMNDLSDRHRAALKARAKMEFKDLDTQLEKLRKQ